MDVLGLGDELHFVVAADVVLSEATYLDANIPAPIHLSAKQAGAAAREANAERLILTHLWPMIDRVAAIEEGSEAFGTGVTLATQGLVTTI